jgi:hypothetical protein
MLHRHWIKASASYANGNCVEVRARADGRVEVRNSRFPGIHLPAFTPQEWMAFMDGVRAGEFDLRGEAAGPL